jgi:hypothetical protein
LLLASPTPSTCCGTRSVSLKLRSLSGIFFFFSRLSDEVNAVTFSVFGDVTPRSSVNNTSLPKTRRPFPVDLSLDSTSVGTPILHSLMLMPE